MDVPPEWKSDGFFILIKERDSVTGETWWKRAEQGEFAVILDAAVAAEREACAKIADAHASDMDGFTEQVAAAEQIAAAIRNRSATP